MREFAGPLSRLVEEFEKLPGIGARTAERLAFYLLKVDKESALGLSHAIRDVKQKLRPCVECFNITESELCRICQSTTRDRTVLCVVEHPKDLLALEKSGSYQGLYHVLMGHISPHEGIAADQLTVAALVKRLGREEYAPVQEVILATNADAEGDATALVLKSHLEPLGLQVTRLARGLPIGGTIEFANVEILREAFSGRTDLQEEG